MDNINTTYPKADPIVYLHLTLFVKHRAWKVQRLSYSFLEKVTFPITVVQATYSEPRQVNHISATVDAKVFFTRWFYCYFIAFFRLALTLDEVAYYVFIASHMCIVLIRPALLDY